MIKGIGDAFIGIIWFYAIIGVIVGAIFGIGLWLLIPWLWHHVTWI